jgi:hypothetical protein
VADEEATSMLAIIDRALEHYRRERFLREANADYEAFEAESKGLKEGARGEARLKRHRGRVTFDTLQQIDNRLRILLGL